MAGITHKAKLVMKERGKPFGFEGHKRKKAAEDGIAQLRDRVDSLIIIPND